MSSNKRLFRAERAAEFAFICCFAIFATLVYNTFFGEAPKESMDPNVSFITSSTETAVIDSNVETLSK